MWRGKDDPEKTPPITTIKEHCEVLCTHTHIYRTHRHKRRHINAQTWADALRKRKVRIRNERGLVEGLTTVEKGHKQLVGPENAVHLGLLKDANHTQ